MSHAYELFYANHRLVSKMESCALCFQAADDAERISCLLSDSLVTRHISLLLPFFAAANVLASERV